MKPLPGANATSNEMDEYFNEYFPETQALAIAAEQFVEYLNGKLETVQQRATYINGIPGQARWFIKFRSGISDVLKGKCLPRNKHTADVIKMLQKEAAAKRKAMQIVLNAGHLYNQQNLEMRKAYFLKLFAAAYLKGSVEDYKKFAPIAQKQYKAAVADEKTAIALLDTYLKDKAAMKEAPPDEYKKFKTAYELVAKNLKD